MFKCLFKPAAGALCALGLALTAAPRAGADVTSVPQGGITVFNFDNAALAQTTIAASGGSGTASRGAGFTTAYTLPAGTSPSTVAAFSSTNFVASSTEAASVAANKYIEFDPTNGTVGYTNIGFTFDAQSSATGPDKARVYYSTDGTNFVAAGSAAFTISIAATYAGSPFYLDLSGVAGLANNPNAKFRIYPYATGAAATSAGTFRIDNVGILGFSSLSTANFTASSTQISAAAIPGTASTSFRLTQINTNVNSPYYGYLYASDQQNNANAGIRIYRPDDGTGTALPAFANRTAATAYVDTGWIAKTITPSAFSPAGFFVNPEDDSIWILDAGVGTEIVERAAHPSAGTPTVTASEVFRPAGPGIVNTASTTLSAAATAAATTVSLTSTTGFPAAGRIQIDSEQLDYTTLGTTLTVTRGVNGTTAAAHNAGATVTVSPAVTIRSMWLRGKTLAGTGEVFLGNTANGAGTGARFGYKQNPDLTWNNQNFLVTTNQGFASFGSVADDAGISYFPKPIQTTGRTIAYKYNADGTGGTEFGVVPSWIPNTTIAGGWRAGNYIYYMADNGSTTGIAQVLVFDLSGNFVEGFGPAVAAAPTDGTYQTLSLVGSLTINSLTADDRGNIYLHSVVGGNQSIQKISRTAHKVLAGGPIASAPAAFGGVAYFGANDGKLYAVSSSTGKALTGFPVNLTSAVAAGGSSTGMAANAGRKILGRPALRIIGGVTYLFATTNDGYTVALYGANTPTTNNGVVLWAQQGLTTVGLATVNTTPGVRSDAAGTLAQADVFVSMSDGGASAGVFRYEADSGALLGSSMNLATAASGATISSPSVNGAGVFVGLVGGDYAAYRLALADLSVQQTVGAGEGAVGAPFITSEATSYPRAVIGTTNGNFSAYNATTGGVQFQDVDVTPSGAPSLSSPFVLYSVAYMAGSDGIVYQANILDGSAPTAGYAFYSGASGASVSGLAVDPAGVNGVPPAGLDFVPALAFGDSSGKYYKVALNDSTKAVIQNATTGAFTTPTIDATTSALVLGNADGGLYRFERR